MSAAGRWALAADSTIKSTNSASRASAKCRAIPGHFVLAQVETSHRRRRGLRRDARCVLTPYHVQAAPRRSLGSNTVLAPRWSRASVWLGCWKYSSTVRDRAGDALPGGCLHRQGGERGRGCRPGVNGHSAVVLSSRDVAPGGSLGRSNLDTGGLDGYGGAEQHGRAAGLVIGAIVRQNVRVHAGMCASHGNAASLLWPQQQPKYEPMRHE
jgi:hypothetical protein